MTFGIKNKEIGRKWIQDVKKCMKFCKENINYFVSKSQ